MQKINYIKDPRIKNGLILIFIAVLMVSLFSCVEDVESDGKVLAKINDFELTAGEFQRQLADEMDLDRNFKLTKESREEYLDVLIRKELLIQEAVKLNLDRKEKFIQAIERYWESMLIRDLMEIEGKKISRRALVPREEIEEYYNKMSGEEKVPPLPEIEEEIIRELKEKKKTRMMKQWVNGLKEKAEISVDREVFENL